jgi:tetratricopeptide (TPR) repeat protein
MSSRAAADAKAQLKRAREELDSGDVDAALALCKKILAADRANYNAYILVGVASARKGETPRAVQAYDRAIAVKPAAPVAYKGIVDALRAVPDLGAGGSAELLLRRARAQVSLADLSPQHAEAARADAAATLYPLAVADAALVPEALAAWRALTPPALPGHVTRVNSVVATLAASALGLPSRDRDGEEEAGMYECDDDLREALDALQRVGAPLGTHETDVCAQALIVDRLRLRLRSGAVLFCDAAAVLRRLGESEACLAMAEEDAAAAAGDSLVGQAALHACASRALHFAGSADRSPRAAAVVSTLYLQSGGSEEKATELVDTSSARLRSRAAKRQRASGMLARSNAAESACALAALTSPMQALVRARLHFSAGENKQCCAAAARGVELCTELKRRGRYKAILRLLAATAFAADRRLELAAAEYGRVLAWCRGEGRQGELASSARWIEHAGLRGEIRARRACLDGGSEAEPEAVLSACASTFDETVAMGTLEKLWRAALGGKGDVSAMEALAERAVCLADGDARATGTGRPSWEQSVLGDPVVGFREETAALASMRLAQMYCHDWSSGPSPGAAEGLRRAKEHLIKSASLVGSLPGPYALLGWTFEVTAAADGAGPSEAAKLIARASRCYRKCLSLDPAHPLAARRLARILAQARGDGGIGPVVSLARDVTDRNPRARWAWNVLGWSRLERGMVAEAAAAFQSALKGNGDGGRLDGDLFGTSAGAATASSRDSDIAVDLDSWRGLSTAYQSQRKLAPACSCIDAALDLIPAHAGEAGACIKQHVATLTMEKGALLTALGKADEALAVLLPALGAAVGPIAALSPCTASHASRVTSRSCGETETRGGGDGAATALASIFTGDAYMAIADELWQEGWFHRATVMRRTGATCLANGVAWTLRARPPVSPSAAYKRLGDALRVAASDAPSSLARLVPASDAAGLLADAGTAYAHALHYCPWAGGRRGGHDLGTTLAAEAELVGDGGKARLAVRILASGPNAGPGDCGGLAAAIGIVGRLEGKPGHASAEQHLLATAVERGPTSEKRLAAAASLAQLCAANGETGRASDLAQTALRLDATSWRAWYATGLAREADGRAAGWPRHMVQSTLDAFVEADHLGGGGPDVAGRVSRSAERNVASLQSEAHGDRGAAGREAAVAVAASIRAGTAPSALCTTAARAAAQASVDAGVERALAARDDVDAVSKLSHVFPFSADIVQVLRAQTRR